jgi:signal transduction histidine kinase
VEIREGTSDGPWLTIVVCDNGLGIPADLHTSIFERFVRAHGARDEELGTDGIGLGLTIAAECVQALGGGLRFESAVGVGTAFFIDLPAVVSASPAATASKARKHDS